MIDTHSHIYLDAFDKDRAEVIAADLADGVAMALLPAIDPTHNDKLFEICNAYPERFVPMMGLHPTSVNDNPNFREELAQVGSMAKNPPVGICAIGEAGLDLYWSRGFIREQIEALEFQIELSLELNLPICIHCREAWGETVKVFERYKGRGVRGVLHAYSGSYETLRQLQRYGEFIIGVGGVVTYGGSGYIYMVSKLSPDEILLESDAPYLTPAPHRGRRNRSGYIRFVCAKLAEIYNLSPSEIEERTTHNAIDFFRLQGHLKIF